MEPDGEADVRHRVVGVPEQRCGPLEPPRQQVLVRRLAERAAELTAEVGRGEVGGLRERRDVERLAVARVDDVLRAQQVSLGRDRLHMAWSLKSHARR